MGPSKAWLLSGVCSFRTWGLLAALGVCFPRAVEQIAPAVAEWLYGLPMVLEVIQYTGWLLPTGIGAALAMSIMIPVFQCLTCHYDFDLASNTITIRTVSDDDSLVLNLIYDCDVHRGNLWHFVHSTADLTIRYSTPNNRAGEKTLRWIRNPHEWRQRILQHAGVRQARTVTTF